MRKGESTRAAILDTAHRLAAASGLEGLSLGDLASAIGMSKSGLFAHFRSKEALQLAVLEHAAARAVVEVVEPALKAAPGEPRLRAVLEHWMRWPGRNGCLFLQASAELDDRPGPLRERLRGLQRSWLDFLANLARGAVDEGHLRADVDAEQLAHDLYGVMLVTHHYVRLLEDPTAEARARRALDLLLAAGRPAAGAGARRTAR